MVMLNFPKIRSSSNVQTNLCSNVVNGHCCIVFWTDEVHQWRGRVNRNYKDMTISVSLLVRLCAFYVCVFVN